LKRARVRASEARIIERQANPPVPSRSKCERAGELQNTRPASCKLDASTDA
jgi:hypothetical protein